MIILNVKSELFSGNSIELIECHFKLTGIIELRNFLPK